MKRPAFTLIELVITMTAGIALMMLSIALLQQSMRLTSAARHRVEAHRVLDRCARQFRQDVHRAAECTVADSSRITMVMADGTEVVYVAEPGNVTRRQGDDRRESYSLGETTGAEFDQIADPGRAVMTVATETPLKTSRIDRQVSAVIGRWSQLESVGASP